MRKLRIGMFSWESLYSIRIGGISPHVSELSDALAAKGHEVHLFTRDRENKDKLINGVHYHKIACDQSGGIVEQMNRMCNGMYCRFLEVRESAGEFDILHGHDWHPVNVLCRIRAQFRLPFVLTFHSTEWGRNGNRHGSWWEAKEISNREWLGGYESSEVITTSAILKNEIRQIYKIPDYKLWEIPNGINVGKIKRRLDPGNIKKHYGIHPHRPVVLFTGRVSYQKGPDLPENVELLKFIEDTYPYLKNSDAVIAPGGHSTIMEALNFGIPVLSFPDQGHSEQENNAEVIEGEGYGRMLSYSTPPEVVLECVREVLEEERYRNKTQRLRKLARELY